MFPWGEATRAASGGWERRGRSYSGASWPLPAARWFPRLVALILTSTLFVLIPAAHIRPTDPTWIAGLYDDCDYDDAVLAIIDGTGLVASHRPVISRLWLLMIRLSVVDSTGPSVWSRISPVERAPPRRLTSAF